MRGLCGLFSDRADSDIDSSLRHMLAAGRTGAAESRSMCEAGGGLAVFGSVARPMLIELDGFVLAVAGHPRLRTAQGRTADLNELAQAVRSRGKDALATIGGDFALAAWDETHQRGLIAIDRIGVHQLVYTRVGDALVFASTLDLLGGHPAVQRKLSSQGIFDYLYFHVCPGPQTIFSGLVRVPPGHCLEFGRGAPAAPSAYWSLQFSEARAPRFEELKEEFMTILQSSVQEAAEGAASGSFLSGGTDSSTVSGMLKRVSNGPARTFSIGFDAEGYDETEYARISAKYFGCEHHEYYVSPLDVVASLPKIAASYDQPFGNASAIPTYQCARFAQDNGIGRLLAGDGGDELFGGNERYAKHHLLDLYQRVPQGLRRGLIEPLVLNAPLLDRVRPLRRLRSYVEQAMPPMPQRYESYNLLQHLGVANVLSRDFLAEIDTEHPRRLMIDAHAPYAGDSLINQMLGIDMRFILADGDLPKVTHMCNLANVDVTFPLLDDRLIEFSQRLPSDMKLRGTKLRWFFKEALLDFLPAEVITKKKHGFGLPVGPWLLGHKPLLDMALESIDSLRPRGIVRPQFIDELVKDKLHEHPAYYGTMVWLLMMLGLWLDSRKL